MFSQWCNAGFEVRLGEIKAAPQLTARLTENVAALPSCTVRNPKKPAAPPYAVVLLMRRGPGSLINTVAPGA